MHLRFLTPDLPALDQCRDELLVANLFEDKRPAQGVAGLVDWRCHGKIAHLLTKGFIAGNLGEVLLVAAKPRLPFDKILFVGAGGSTQWDEGVYCGLIERILRTVEALCIRNLTIQLPGREYGLIDAPRASELLLEAAEGNQAHDTWTLLESTADQKRIATKRRQNQRRPLDQLP